MKLIHWPIIAILAIVVLSLHAADRCDSGDAKADLVEALKKRIGPDGDLGGKFTKEEIDKLVQILRSGKLPAPLKTKPIAETTIEELRKLLQTGKRGALHDAVQLVRGDSGKWNDDAQLLRAPPIAQKPAKMTLDAWVDQLVKKKIDATEKEESWLIFRSEQLNDNDRIWIERIERRGQQINIVAHQATWQGKYFRNFTYYQVVGVNLGKLEAGKYDVKWVRQPFVFAKFDGDGKALDSNWPKDERPADKKPTETRLTFTVSKS